ncbi:MAG: ROK family protein [Clostridiales Family XIII bacterium]|nr:ROK family protein [Clostridiales Family XIII bacterium]
MRYDFGIDIGGTNIDVGLVKEHETVVSRRNIKTQQHIDPKSAIEVITASMIEQMDKFGLTSSDISSIGIGITGIIDHDKGILQWSPNLVWKDLHFSEEFEGRLGIKTVVENDANAAAIGEFFLGAGRGAVSSILVTLGTGIGGGFVNKGILYKGINGSEVEIGHMVINKGGRECHCGRKGCFERYASASGLKITIQEKMAEYEDSLMWTLEDGDATKVSTHTAFDAAALGDQAAKEALELYYDDLALGLTNVINIFQPDMVILSGGLTNVGEELMIPVRERVAKEVYSKNTDKNASIRVATLGNDTGILGAANIIRARED